MKNQGFNIPNDYFSKMEDRIIASTLKSENGFTVPKDYFDSLETRLVEKTLIREQRTPKLINLYKVLKSASGIAAVFLIGYFISNSEMNAEQSIDQGLAYEYLESENFNLDTDKLYNSISNIDELSASDFIENIDLNDVESFLEYEQNDLFYDPF
ncbi:MAG: hypothetical protein ACPGRE_04220 [Flavobacteriaceae bacterium]